MTSVSHGHKVLEVPCTSSEAGERKGAVGPGTGRTLLLAPISLALYACKFPLSPSHDKLPRPVHFRAGSLGDIAINAPRVKLLLCLCRVRLTEMRAWNCFCLLVNMHGKGSKTYELWDLSGYSAFSWIDRFRALLKYL